MTLLQCYILHQTASQLLSRLSFRRYLSDNISTQMEAILGHILRCCESTTKGFHSKERILIYQYNYLIPFYFLRGEFVIYCSKTKIRVKEGSYFIEVCVPHFNVLGLIRSHCASMFCIMNSF